jgi:uncharacterized membrane-anchored protein
MDKHFMSIIAIGVIILGLIGIIAGAIMIGVMQDPMAGSVFVALGSNALGVLGGVMAAPKVQSLLAGKENGGGTPPN